MQSERMRTPKLVDVVIACNFLRLLICLDDTLNALARRTFKIDGGSIINTLLHTREQTQCKVELLVIFLALTDYHSVNSNNTVLVPLGCEGQLQNRPRHKTKSDRNTNHST